MQKIKHIWKYLTSPPYRYWVDLCSQQELIDRNMKMIEQNIHLMAHPMFYFDDGGKINKLK